MSTPDEWLTQAQAARKMNVSLATFWRLRRLYARQLKPAIASPLRWSRNALDCFMAAPKETAK